MAKSDKLGEYEYNKVPIEDGISEKKDVPLKYGYGVRHIQALIVFLCLTVNIIGRGHLGVTIVAMTSDNNEQTTVVNSTEDLYKINATINVTENFNLTGHEVRLYKVINVTDAVNNSEPNLMTYDWPKPVQEMVLGSFFLGYAIMMFPMGMICQRFGGKLPLQISLLINAIVSVVTPWFAIWGGWKAVCCCRILQGLSQAGTYPCMQALLAKWVPANERASLGSCVYNGLTIGTIIGFHIAGILGASKWGWPSTFYTIGAISLICFIIMTVFGASSPLEHKSISEEEKNFIMSSGNDDHGKKLKTPWRAILVSKPLWGTIITHIGSNVAFVFFFTQAPSYIHHILGINVKNSGLLSSLPYVASFFTNLGFGWLSDYCTNKKYISLTNARRACNSIATVGLASCLVLTSYTNNVTVAMMCLVVGMAANMGMHSGWMVNYIDLSPNFSGTLTATGNTLGNICVTLCPIIVSYVVTDTTNQIQWRIMFIIIASLYLVTNAIFVVLASSEIQPWNFAEEDTKLNVEDAKDTKVIKNTEKEQNPQK